MEIPPGCSSAIPFSDGRRVLVSGRDGFFLCDLARESLTPLEWLRALPALLPDLRVTAVDEVVPSPDGQLIACCLGVAAPPGGGTAVCVASLDGQGLRLIPPSALRSSPGQCASIRAARKTQEDAVERLPWPRVLPWDPAAGRRHPP